MTKESKTYSDNQLRQLIDAYFEGSISQSQLTTLIAAAKEYAEGESSTDDPQLAEDLRAVSAIEQYAQAALLSYEEKVPVDLEALLDNHISHLASRSRRKWMWIKAVSAAACVALVLTAGIHYVNPFLTSPTPQSEDNVGIASAIKPTDLAIKPSVASESVADTLSEPTTNKPSELNAIPRTAGAASSNINRKRNLRASNRKNSVKTLAASTSINLPHPMSETTIPNIEGAVVMPETLPHIPDIMPTLLTAKVEVQQLITSPFAAIGQTFDKVVESLNVVNATMYEANKTAASVSREFFEASTAPLRSI